MLFFVVVVLIDCWFFAGLYSRENKHFYTLHCFKDFLNDHVLRARTKRLSILFNSFFIS